MGNVIVVQFITLDGVVEDPDGSDGTDFGGWAMRHGPEVIAADPFGLTQVLENGTLLLGRHMWEHFTKLWPGRDDPFSRTMNAAPKAVASRSLTDTTAWSNSQVISGDLIDWVRKTAAAQDVVVMGSGSVVTQLQEAGLVGEYRLLQFPTAVGGGRRLFTGLEHLEMTGAKQQGPVVRTTYAASAR